MRLDEWLQDIDGLFSIFSRLRKLEPKVPITLQMNRVHARPIVYFLCCPRQDEWENR